MKICITGITGLLGSNLAFILKNDYDIYGIDRHDLNMDKVNNAVMDIEELDILDELIHEFMPDILIHCLAEVNVDSCEENNTNADFVNISITEQLVRTCKKIGAKLIFISTDAVFNGDSNSLYDENDMRCPVNHYGETKVRGEDIVLSVEENLVIRTNIYGINMRDKYSLSEWVLNSMRSGQTISMFEDAVTSPILVNEFVRVMKIIVEAGISGIYHLVSSGSMSKYQFGVKIKEVFSIPTGTIAQTSIDDFGFKAKRGKNLSLENHKLCEKLNISIQTPEEGILQLKKLYDSGYDIGLKKCFVTEEEIR